jgi:hypothetical protein
MELPEAPPELRFLVEDQPLLTPVSKYIEELKTVFLKTHEDYEAKTHNHVSEISFYKDKVEKLEASFKAAEDRGNKWMVNYQALEKEHTEFRSRMSRPIALNVRLAMQLDEKGKFVLMDTIMKEREDDASRPV